MKFTTTEKDGLKYELEVEKEHIELLKNIISKLTKERDEARVSVCKLTSQLNQELGAETLSPRQNAAQLGWVYLTKENQRW